MEELGFVGNNDVDEIMKIMEEIDLENIFNYDDDVPEEGLVDSWMGDLEQLLLINEGDDAQIFDSSPEVEKNSVTCSEDIDDGAVLAVDDSKEDEDSDENDDPKSKKRKRQLRNRDAAMRSRERKKMYVKDLEIKSQYLEAECRRLGRLLQCCYAENQMLRFSVQSGNTFGSSMAKPESAVLLPESLLLGSLVWLMGLMCLHPLAMLLLLSQDVVALASVNRKNLESAAPPPRRKVAKAIELWLPLSFLTSKRCKASRTKMKSHFDSMLRCSPVVPWLSC